MHALNSRLLKKRSAVPLYSIVTHYCISLSSSRRSQNVNPIIQPESQLHSRPRIILHNKYQHIIVGFKFVAMLIFLYNLESVNIVEFKKLRLK